MTCTYINIYHAHLAVQLPNGRFLKFYDRAYTYTLSCASRAEAGFNDGLETDQVILPSYPAIHRQIALF